jgi:hypothetical protein
MCKILSCTAIIKRISIIATSRTALNTRKDAYYNKHGGCYEKLSLYEDSLMNLAFPRQLRIDIAISL